MGYYFGELYVNNLYGRVIQKIIEDNVEIKKFVSEQEYILKELVCKEIMAKCYKSMIYCLNYGRIKGKLIGNTSEERYTYFNTTDYCISSMNALFPNMLEQIYNEIKNKFMYFLNVIKSYYKNQKEISKHFFENKNDRIVKIENSGDWHNDKCVLMIELESGANIVYKPSKGKNIEYFKGVISYFFDEEYVSQYDYVEDANGVWVKYIKHEEIEDEEDINEFYTNYGKLMYIAYLLGINDLHHENMIAYKKYPIIIDLETIFSSYLFYEQQEKQYDAFDKATKKLLYDVASTGLLPIESMSDYFGGDVSCLSNSGFRVSAEKIHNINRDDMHIKVEMKFIKENNHLPNKTIQPLDYGKYIVEGFLSANEIFKRNKKMIVDYIVKNIYKVESRVLFNMTKEYSRILRMKNEVAYRVEEKKYRELISKLKRKESFIEKIYDYEAKELLRGNIPSFYWNIEEKNVYGYDGKSRTMVNRSGNFDTEKLIEIINYQTKDDTINEEVKLISNSVISMYAVGIEYQNLSRDTYINKENEICSNNLRSNLDHQRIEGNDGTITWIGLMVNDNEKLEYAILDWSLYSGVIGIGMMYISEYIQNRDVESKNILKRLLNTIELLLEKNYFDDMDVSYYNGLTGIYSFLINLRKISIISNKKIDFIIDKIKVLIINNIEKTDINDNLSGINSSVIYYYNRLEEDAFAREVFNREIDYFIKYFDAKVFNSKYRFAGFAHGYSGIITSLFCMNKIKENEKFKELIRIFWENENTLKVGRFEWKDLRKENRECSHFWCHGSCGNYFARLLWKKWKFLEDDIIEYTEKQLDEDIDKYVEQIENRVFDTSNYSLCHGNFAFIDFLISYGKLRNIDITNIGYIHNTIIEGEKKGYSCLGAKDAINAIGFMVGESGIQYVLNRCKNIELSSILMMEVL